MKLPLLTAAAVAAAVVLWRRRHAGAPPSAPGEVTPEEHIEANPLVIMGSDDPDDLLGLLAAGWSGALDGFEAIRAREVGEDKGAQVEARHAMQRAVIDAVQLDAAEDAVVWPAVASALDDGEALAAAAGDRSLELRRLLTALDHLHPDDAGWDGALSIVAKAVYEREVWARTSVWPPLSRAVDAPRRAELGRALRAAREAAPTRPHLPSSGKHHRFDSLVARLDRVEDSIGHRG